MKALIELARRTPGVAGASLIGALLALIVIVTARYQLKVVWGNGALSVAPAETARQTNADR